MKLITVFMSSLNMLMEIVSTAQGSGTPPAWT